MLPKNLGKQDSTSLTLTRHFNPLIDWNISVSTIGYHIRIDISFGESRDFNIRRFAPLANIQQAISLPFKLKSEVVYSYYSKRPGGSNELMKSSNQLDIGFQRKLFNDRSEIKIAFTDIFWGATGILSVAWVVFELILMADWKAGRLN